ncbi:type II secretion system protein GspD [Synechococcus sp. GEYO]|uniref:type II secretion system protein GspD n=1 Tax=Synechococcus sp. GEYO TaxID=2575511 RepID=UPI00352ED6AD
MLDFAVRSVSRAAHAQGDISLRIRRSQNGVEVVVDGVGEQPVLQQRLNGQVWEGRLQTQGVRGLHDGLQQLSDSTAGLRRVAISGSGNDFVLRVIPEEGQILQEPLVSADGRSLILRFSGLVSAPSVQTGELDLTMPGAVSQTRYAPPLRPRAVAPPLGDMAVGTMVLQNRSYVNVSGPAVTLSLKNASAKDAILSIAKLGGYGFVYLNDSNSNGGESGDDPRLVTMTFSEETYQRALNSLLMASGLQAKLEGRTLMVGLSVSDKTFGPQMSKVYRLNQASAASAADYLASLGARISKINLISITSGEPTQSGGTAINNKLTQEQSSLTQVESYGASSGPLRGLNGTTDSRLQTITLVGDSRLVNVAEGYLKQIDLRQRQVAVKVQILNIDLLNDKTIDSSFSAKIGNTFLVSESGKAFINFGQYRPGNSQGTGTLGNGTPYAEPGNYNAGVPAFASQRVVDPVVAGNDVVGAVVAKNKVFSPPFVEAQEQVAGIDGSQQLIPKVDSEGRPVYVASTDPAAAPALVPSYDSNGQPVYIPTTDPTVASKLVPRYDSNGQPIYVPSTDPAASQTLVPRYDKNGQVVYVPGKDPKQFSYPNNSFFGYLEAVIQSSSTKTLAQPTLLVQEGQEAKVETGTSVITSVSTTDTSNGSTQFEYTRQNAGLNLKIKVNKIDDNGFVSLNLDPEISVPIPAGQSNGVDIYNISGRSLSSGSIRLRDRQTLVLTGVIQDQDKEQVTKWPILGDLPFIGQLFRRSGSSRTKNELVILVTPMIIDDEDGGSYGYGYRPSTRETRQLMRGS